MCSHVAVYTLPICTLHALATVGPAHPHTHTPAVQAFPCDVCHSEMSIHPARMHIVTAYNGYTCTPVLCRLLPQGKACRAIYMCFISCVLLHTTCGPPHPLTHVPPYAGLPLRLLPQRGVHPRVRLGNEDDMWVLL